MVDAADVADSAGVAGEADAVDAVDAVDAAESWEVVKSRSLEVDFTTRRVVRPLSRVYNHSPGFSISRLHGQALLPP